MSSTPNPHIALADAAEQRANAATPGPWIHLPECANEYKIASQARPPMSFGFDEPPDDGLEPLGIGQTCQGDCRADLNFIAHARQDVPALAAAVRELDKVNAEQAAQLEKVMMERDEYKQAFNDELDGAHSLRLACGAKENETMVGFVRRLVEERDFAVREQAATTTALEAKLTEALALAEAGWIDGYEAAGGDISYLAHISHTYVKSETRAAAERLKGTV